MIVLGVDPGTRHCGVAAIRREGSSYERVGSEVLSFPPSAPLADRLNLLHTGLAECLARWSPDVAAVESVFHHKNARSALTLGHARGVVLLACAQAGLEVHEYPPATVKNNVAGNGAAGKPQVRRMVELILGCTLEGSEDESDALAVALCHAQGEGMRRAVARAGGDR